MTSILKADTIQDADGNNIINENSNTITIGASGDTVNVIGTLQSNGTAVPTVAGGITEADMYRLTASVSGDLTPISSNIERVDDATFAKIGTGVSVSSGVFTFPSTGLYLIQLIPMFFFDGAADSNINALIQGTANNSSYDTLAVSEVGGDQGSNKKKEGLAETYFNCTDVSTHKIRFTTESMNNNSLLGDTDKNETTFVFIRLGDSQ